MTSTELFEKYNCVYGYMVSVTFKEGMRIPLLREDASTVDVAVFTGVEKDVAGFIDVLQTDFFNAYAPFLSKKYDYGQFLKDTNWTFRKFPLYKLF